MKLMALHVVVLSLGCWAADDIKPFALKPGLWERTVTVEGQVSDESLAKMPPAERARVEAIMKDRKAAPMTAKVCLVRESMGKPFTIPGQNCTTKLVSASPSRQEIHLDCPSGPHATSGDVVLESVDTGHAKATMIMKNSTPGDTPGGDPTDGMKMTLSDKWLSAECGDVKPTGAK